MAGEFSFARASAFRCVYVNVIGLYKSGIDPWISAVCFPGSCLDPTLLFPLLRLCWLVSNVFDCEPLDKSCKHLLFYAFVTLFC